MEQELQKLKEAVEAQGTVIGSGVTLLNKLGQMVRDAADDPVQVRALADQITQKSSELAAAISANTPADNPPNPEPPTPSGPESAPRRR